MAGPAAELRKADSPSILPNRVILFALGSLARRFTRTQSRPSSCASLLMCVRRARAISAPDRVSFQSPIRRECARECRSREMNKKLYVGNLAYETAETDLQ